MASRFTQDRLGGPVHISISSRVDGKERSFCDLETSAFMNAVPGKGPLCNLCNAEFETLKKERHDIGKE